MATNICSKKEIHLFCFLVFVSSSLCNIPCRSEYHGKNKKVTMGYHTYVRFKTVNFYFYAKGFLGTLYVFSSNIKRQIFFIRVCESRQWYILFEGRSHWRRVSRLLWQLFLQERRWPIKLQPRCFKSLNFVIYHSVFVSILFLILSVCSSADSKTDSFIENSLTGKARFRCSAEKIFGFLIKTIQETFQQQRVPNKDTALVGRRTVTLASLVLQRKIAWSIGKGNPMLLLIGLGIASLG